LGYSPDGKWWANPGGESGDVIVRDAVNGAEAKRLAAHLGGVNAVRFSPDGRFIAFSSKRGGKEALYVMRADGTGQVRVSRGKGSDSHPVWARW
jgi:TolB protein